ncbi:SigE family RNA polymerase sigma factor [Kineococcus sp. SYSU DK005]|uniref:SigE family RNA polymerase sigma factor n=1 Tax=Kineococcus sp. SYSU DK005 TaxID=3383126 RepID=UPI003D7C81FA
MHTHGRDSQQGPDPTSSPRPAHQHERDFEDWAGAHADELMRTALLLTGEHHLAEDLLQDVLERTYLHWRRIQQPGAYARTVMARAVTDRWRRLGRRPREVPLDALWPEQIDGNRGPGTLSGHHAGDNTGQHRAHDTHDAATRYAEQDEVTAALRRLSPRQRAVLVLRYYEDFTEAQIADALNCSTGTVKTQASRGLARLRELLGASRAQPPDPLSTPARASSPSSPTAPKTLRTPASSSPTSPLPSLPPLPSPQERTR